MALPKGFRNNIRLTSPNIGVPRRQELLDNIADDGTFLPRGVLYQDMDETFIEFINKELNIEIDGNQVPVIFLTLQRYSEFTKTWQFTDEYKNIKIPFITIVRKPDVQVGTNYNGLYNVPGRPTFTYYKVPTNDGARVGIDLYKVPQPTSVDITYEVRLFTNKMSDLNLLNEKIQKKFQSRQAYIWPKGHPMPVMLESIGDESNIDDFENRRFYVQPFEMLLAGYILDENDFEIIPTINRAMVMSEIELADGVTTPITDPKKGGGCIVATQGSVIVRNTNNTVLSVVSCGENYVVGNSLIFNSGNTYSQLVPATTSFQLPNIINYDSDGSPVETPAMVGFTATTCEPAIIINSGATYSASTPAGSTFELPNETIEFVNTTGGTTSFTFPVYSNPIFSANTFCLPVNVTNSGSTYDVWVASGDDLELPNITHIDSNLSPVTLPAQTPFTATTCPATGLTDPSSFADAYALWRSDMGITEVDQRVSEWADQSGNGFDITANGLSNRPYLSGIRGRYDFRDFYSGGLSDQCRATGLSSAQQSAFTYDFLWTNWVQYNPLGYMPCFGNVNAADDMLLCWISGNNLIVQCGDSTNYVQNTYGLGTSLDVIRGTLVWEGSEATAADKIKFYRNGSLVSPSSTNTSGTVPSTTANGFGQFNLSSSTTARRNNVLTPYLAGWQRALTTQEISDNDDWKLQIYNAT